MPHLYRKFRRNAADYGTARSITKAVKYVAQSVYQATAYRVYGLDVFDAEIPQADPASRFTFRPLLATDTPLIRQVEDMAEWLSGCLASRIAAGSFCLVATAGSRVAAFNLVSTGNVALPVVNLLWNFSPREFWSEHIATHQDFRRLGLATTIRYEVIRELKKREVHWFYGGTLRDHPGTLRLASRVGFVETGDLMYRRLLSSQRWEMKRFVNEHARRIAPPFDGIDNFSAHELSLQQASHQA